jgi:2-polyprenyl-3-methyl-5-hydroxy-6-metoxy-1,4-benzoquinol methylase
MNTFDQQLEQYKILHKANSSFGTSATHYTNILDKIFYTLNFQNVTILDYGCGKQVLKPYIENKGFTYVPYDPAIEGIDNLDKTKNYDLVINFDVLEHIKDNGTLDNVIKEILSLSKYCIFAISTRLAGQILPNGENAHCTVHDYKWWLNKFKSLTNCKLNCYEAPDRTILMLCNLSEVKLENKELL